MSIKLASAIRFAVSAFNNVNTRNILAGPEHGRLLLMMLSAETNSKKKISSRSFIDKMAAKFCPTFNIVLPCYTSHESDGT